MLGAIALKKSIKFNFSEFLGILLLEPIYANFCSFFAHVVFQAIYAYKVTKDYSMNLLSKFEVLDQTQPHGIY